MNLDRIRLVAILNSLLAGWLLLLFFGFILSISLGSSGLFSYVMDKTESYHLPISVAIVVIPSILLSSWLGWKVYKFLGRKSARANALALLVLIVLTVLCFPWKTTYFVAAP